MATQITHLYSCNVYVDGNNLLGRSEEVSLPEINTVQSDHNALGLTGTPEFFSGLEKMEFSIKWNSLYKDVAKKYMNPVIAQQMQVRGSLETHTSAGRTGSEAAVAFLTVKPKTMGALEYKNHEKVATTTTYSVTSYKLVVGSEVIFEIDILANIYKVGGVDMLAQYRRDLGI